MRHTHRTSRSSRSRLPHEQARTRPVADGSQIFVPGRGARGRPEALAGNEPPSADFVAAGQGAASHLVIQEVTGQAGQAGGRIDAVRQPFGRWIWS